MVNFTRLDRTFCEFCLLHVTFLFCGPLDHPKGMNIRSTDLLWWRLVRLPEFILGCHALLCNVWCQIPRMSGENRRADRRRRDKADGGERNAAAPGARNATRTDERAPPAHHPSLSGPSRSWCTLSDVDREMANNLINKIKQARH